MSQTGRVLSWLVGVALIGAIFFFLGLVRSNSGQPLPDSLGQALALLILSCEAAAFVVLLVGVVRWPLRIIRSPRWLLSTLGLVLVAAAIVMFVWAAITVAIGLP